MKHPGARRLFDHWEDLRAGRAAPERGELRAGALAPLLGDLLVLALDEGPAPRVRLAGTRVCALVGGELRGARLADLWAPGEREAVARGLVAVADEGRALVGALDGERVAGAREALEVLVLPLRHRGRTHARLLGFLAPLGAPEAWAGPLVRLSTRSLRHLDVGPRGAARARFGPPPGAPPEAVVARRGHLALLEGGRAPA